MGLELCSPGEEGSQGRGQMMGIKAYPQVAVRVSVGMDGGGRPAQESRLSRGECKESQTSPGLRLLQRVPGNGEGGGITVPGP